MQIWHNSSSQWRLALLKLPTSDANSSMSSSPVSSGSLSTSSSSTGSQELIPEKDDPLLPNDADFQRTFHDGVATWTQFLEEARTMAIGSWPAVALDPHNTLADVPSLPEYLPRQHRLFGRACWKFPRDIGTVVNETSERKSFLYGRRMMFLMQVGEVLRCKVSSSAASFSLSDNASFTGSLTVLVMCWLYVLSARILESQGRKIRYTSQRLRIHQRASSPDINLIGASPELTRWLCAILNPDMGWEAQDGE